MIIVHGIVFILGITILVFHRQIGERAEEAWGYLLTPQWPGYARANVFLLGLVLTIAGVWFLISGLLNW